MVLKKAQLKTNEGYNMTQGAKGRLQRGGATRMAVLINYDDINQTLKRIRIRNLKKMLIKKNRFY